MKKIELEVRHDFGHVPMDGLLPIYKGKFKESEIELVAKNVCYFLTKFPAPLDITIEMLEEEPED